MLSLSATCRFPASIFEVHMTHTVSITTVPPWKGPLHWPTVRYFAVVHIIGVIAPFVTFWLDWRTALIMTAFYVFWFFKGQLATTIAAHRLYSHGSFRAKEWLQYYLVIEFSSNVQGSIGIWAGRHRQHHAFEDTDQDPHSPHRGGFWWAHCLWIMRNGGMTMPSVKHARFPMSFSAVKFQHKHNILLALVMAWGVPMLFGSFVGWCFNHVWMGVLIAGLLAFSRLVCQYHLTWVVNSACHLWGEKIQPRLATNLRWLGVLTAAEAYHARHHQLPQHYQIGRGPDESDWAAWLIRWAERRGWVWDVNAPYDPVLE